MKRTISVLSILSFALVMTIVTLAQAPPAQKLKAEHLSKHQLKSLISTAKTPAEHQRIAQYYEAKAQDYLSQSNEHEEMLAAYKQNGYIRNRNQANAIYHCQYFVEQFKEMAAKSQELAQLHEQMAKDAEQK